MSDSWPEGVYAGSVFDNSTAKPERTPLPSGRNDDIRSALAIGAFIIGFGAAASNGIAVVVIDLPDDIEWTSLLDAAQPSIGLIYIREWIPEGTTAADTPWMIVEQKFASEHNAKGFFEVLHDGFRQACGHVVFDGPHEIDVDAGGAAWGRAFCPLVPGGTHAAIVDQLVVADGESMFVVTSELRLHDFEILDPFDFASPPEALKEPLENSAAFIRSVRVVERSGDPPPIRPARPPPH